MPQHTARGHINRRSNLAAGTVTTRTTDSVPHASRLAASVVTSFLPGDSLIPHPLGTAFWLLA